MQPKAGNALSLVPQTNKMVDNGVPDLKKSNATNLRAELVAPFIGENVLDLDSFASPPSQMTDALPDLLRNPEELEASAGKKLSNIYYAPFLFREMGNPLKCLTEEIGVKKEKARRHRERKKAAQAARQVEKDKEKEGEKDGEKKKEKNKEKDMEKDREKEGVKGRVHR
ncbi:hypothetical protein VTI74DRAFT_2684 [Chaetomium olivicolor]